MASDFPRTLALLRKEKKISQRNAANDLEVSQALLSHYENGLREPGLDFVIRAADYYSVSCDYLLGRSMSRDGAATPPARVRDTATDLGNQGITTSNKRLIINSITLLYEIIELTSSKQLSEEVTQYFSLMIYKLFRFLYLADPEGVEAAFRTSSAHFDGLCNSQIALSELRVRAAALGSGDFGLTPENIHLPSLSPADLARNFPVISQSMLTLLQSVADKIEPHKTVRRSDKQSR